MTDLVVLGAVVRASPAAVRAWRAGKTRIREVRGLARELAALPARDVGVEALLDRASDPAAVIGAALMVKSGSVTLTAYADGPDDGTLGSIVAALAALAHAGGTGEAHLARADGGSVFRLTLGQGLAITRLRGKDAARAMQSAPIALAERHQARRVAALAKLGRKAEKEAARSAELRFDAKRRFAKDTDAGFAAVSRAKGRARREAELAALGWLTHDLRTAELRKRVQRDPRWIELALPLLEDDDFGVRADATVVASLAEDRRAVLPLRRRVAAGDGNFAKICDALAKIGDPSAISDLEHARDEQKLPWLRQAAEKAIKKLGEHSGR